MITLSSGITYAGFVTIKEFKDNSLLRTFKLHNNGTETLFRILANALAGTNMSSLMPSYLDLGLKTESSFNSSLSSRVSISGKAVVEKFEPKEDSTTYGYCTKFTTAIPGERFKGNSVNSVNCLRLTNASQSTGTPDTTVLAEILLDNELEFSAVVGYTYIVEWVMTFTNNE